MLPIWNNPLVAWLFMLSIDWGAIMLIRIGWEDHFYWTRWWSFKVGDSVFLPLFGLFAAINIGDEPLTGWQSNFYWHAVIFAVGLLISVAIEQMGIRGGRDSAITGLPSQLWHTAIFPVMFYLVVWALVLTITQRNDNLWALAGELLCLLGFALMLALDGRNQSPEQLIDGIRK